MYIPHSISSHLVMNFLYLLPLALFPSGTLSDFFAYKQPNGQTKLAGSSFGLLGVNATFDYVVRSLVFDPSRSVGLLTENQVIGGGTAGLTVAARLAENAAVSVAVIEGGSFYEIDNGNFSQIPAYDSYFAVSPPSTSQPLIDWGIITVPQAVCRIELHFLSLWGLDRLNSTSF